MNIISLSENKIPKGAFVVALGMFDGLHLGHMKLVECAKEMAKSKNAKIAIFTFEKVRTRAVCTDKVRFELFEKAGIDTVFVGDFESMRNMSPVEFANALKDQMGAVGAVCGFNFRFGKNASGEASDLKRLGSALGIEVSVLPCQKIGDDIVSSTLIRQAVMNGDMEKAKALLGRPFFMDGTVVKGRRVGHVIGYPTMNTDLPENVIKPPNGVYFTCVITKDGEYPAITNVGTRPTFGLECVNIESHIITDFSREAYGEDIRIVFYKYNRPEVRFRSVDQLKETLLSDLNGAKEYFNVK